MCGKKSKNNIILTLLALLLTCAPLANAATTVTATADNQTMIPSQAVIVDDGVTIVYDLGNITNGKVMIASGFVSGSDTLAWDTATADSISVTGSFSSTTGVLTFSGTATPTEWQTLFRTVTLTTTSSSSTTRTVTFSIGNAIPFSGNNHFYEFVTAASITWTDANTAANGKTLFGLQGYLTTVTSAEENAFVAGKLAGEGWMGASDAATESDWKWVTGPEAGTSFFTQTSAASGSGSLNTVYGGNTPGGGVAVGGNYNNWQGGEPNDWGASGEDYAHFRSDGTWNDYPTSLGSIAGYVVEYGGMADDPAVTLSASRGVAVKYTVTPSAGTGGSITPNTAQTVDPGATPSFTVSADANYSISGVSDTCGGSLVGNTYTTGAVSANCTVVASFAINTYTLGYRAGDNGSLTGTLAQNIDHGANGSAVTAEPDDGYRFVNWSDGATVNPRTDTNVTANLDVTANFASDSTAGSINGSVLKSGGGGGALGGLPLIGLLLLALARLRIRQHLAVVIVGFALVTATPSVKAGEGSWYLGLQYGSATTDVDSSEVTQQLAEQGISGTASVSDNTRGAWKLYGGYGFSDHFAVEGGYTDLGQITTRFTGTGSASLAQLVDIAPVSGTGLELSVLGRYPFAQRLVGFGRVGLWRWKAYYELTDASGADSDEEPTGTDFVYGLGLDMRLGNAWLARLSWDRYRIDGDDSDFLGLGAVWRFRGN